MDEQTREAHAAYRRESFQAQLEPLEARYYSDSMPLPGEHVLRLTYNDGMQWPVVAALTPAEMRVVRDLLTERLEQLEAEHAPLGRIAKSLQQDATEGRGHG